MGEERARVTARARREGGIGEAAAVVLVEHAEGGFRGDFHLGFCMARQLGTAGGGYQGPRTSALAERVPLNVVGKMHQGAVSLGDVQTQVLEAPGRGGGDGRAGGDFNVLFRGRPIDVDALLLGLAVARDGDGAGAGFLVKDAEDEVRVRQIGVEIGEDGRVGGAGGSGAETGLGPLIGEGIFRVALDEDAAGFLVVNGLGLRRV